jgi:hypothetical protein
MKMLAMMILPVLGLALCLARFLYSLLLHPLRKFPGPFWAAHTDLWRVYHLTTRKLPQTLHQLHSQYGPIVRIGPNDLSFDGVEIVEQVYRGGRKYIKSEFYDGFTTFHPNLFGTRDEEVIKSTSSRPTLNNSLKQTTATRQKTPADGSQLFGGFAKPDGTYLRQTYS